MVLYGTLFYRPLPKQLEAHKSPCSYRVAAGGNRSGKTAWGFQEAYWWMTDTHPYRETPSLPVSVGVLSPSHKQQRDSSQKTAMKLIPKDVLAKSKVAYNQKANDLIDFIRLPNGSRIIFRSCESGLEAIMGCEVDLWWIDEEIPERFFIEAQMRVGAGRDLQFIFTLTTLKGRTWIMRDIIERGLNDEYEDYFSTTMSIYENSTELCGGWLNQNAIKKIERQFSGDDKEWERAVRMEGKLLPISADNVFAATNIMRWGGGQKHSRIYAGSHENPVTRRDNSYWQFWKKPDPKEAYVMTIDPSTGKAQSTNKDPDYSVIHIYAIKAAEQVAEYRARSLGLELAREAKVGHDTFKGCRPMVIVPEVNKESTILELVAELCPDAVMYRREGELDNLTGKFVSKSGWFTSRRNKMSLITHAMDVVREHLFIIHSPETYEEFSNYVKTKDGFMRAEAAPGYHDDCVMSSMIAWFVIRHWDLMVAEKKDEKEKTSQTVEDWMMARVPVFDGQREKELAKLPWAGPEKPPRQMQAHEREEEWARSTS